jgi:hypothetical protein
LANNCLVIYLAGHPSSETDWQRRLGACECVPPSGEGRHGEVPIAAVGGCAVIESRWYRLLRPLLSWSPNAAPRGTARMEQCW